MVSMRAADPHQFTTTHWSVVLAAGEEDSPLAREALGALCRTYWYPLYAFVRRQGHNPEDAQDLTQSFFAQLLEGNLVENAQPERGRFRAYLLTAMRHFLADEWRRTQTQKRGGDAVVISLDAPVAEERYRQEPVEMLDAERIYERRWALTFLEQVLARLREHYTRGGKGEQFVVLEQFLLGDKGSLTYAEAAVRLDMNEGGVRTAVRRLRQRYQEFFRREIAQTVARPAEIDQEIAYLLRVLAAH